MDGIAAGGAVQNAAPVGTRSSFFSCRRAKPNPAVADGQLAADTADSEPPAGTSIRADCGKLAGMVGMTAYVAKATLASMLVVVGVPVTQLVWRTIDRLALFMMTVGLRISKSGSSKGGLHHGPELHSRRS
jgi:hypothetical protein